MSDIDDIDIDMEGNVALAQRRNNLKDKRSCQLLICTMSLQVWYVYEVLLTDYYYYLVVFIQDKEDKEASPLRRSPPSARRHKGLGFCRPCTSRGRGGRRQAAGGVRWPRNSTPPEARTACHANT